MNWFNYEIGDTVETPIGDAIITMAADDTGRCTVMLIKERTEHELTTFQFSKILKKKSENVSIDYARAILDSFTSVSLQCDPKSVIPILQLATKEKWEYHHGDCCSKGYFVRIGVKL